MLCYSLNKNLGCEKICKDISDLINKISKQENGSPDLLLVIDIKPVTESNQCLLPRLEHKK